MIKPSYNPCSYSLADDLQLKWTYEHKRGGGRDIVVEYPYRCECGYSLDGHESFCPDCGQELDWSEVRQ